MKKVKLLSTLAALVLGVVIMSSCTKEKIVEKEVIVAASTYSISGVVNYPGGLAGGALVYLIGDVTATTFADANGAYSFGNLLPGSYSVYANYNTDNTNVGRYTGMTFLGSNIDVTIAAANVSQDINLTTTASTGVAVNSSTSGTWTVDTNHSEIEFAFPYDGVNSEFSGRFDIYNVEVVLDDANLAGSSITASVDLLTVKTGQPGRDGYYSTLNATETADSLDLAGNRVTWFNGGCINKTLGAITGSHGTTVIVTANQLSTWVSTSIEHFGDGYLAHGTFTLNGISIASDLYFKYLPGYLKGIAPAQTQMASFEGKFTFLPADVSVSSSHILDANVDVYANIKVSAPL